MKKLYTLLFLAVSAFTVNAQTTFTQWTFDDQTTNPTIGSGTISYVGGVTAPPSDGGGAFPGGWTGTAAGGFAYSSTGYPAQGTGSGTAGFQFNVSTVGFENVIVSLTERASGTASKWVEYQYTTNGTTWNTLMDNGGLLDNDFATNTVTTLDFSSVPAADNNANFAVRVVTIFAPSTTAYAAIGTGAYAGGNFRIDNVAFQGTPLSAGVNKNTISGLKMFPNPLSGNTLNITSDNNADKMVAIYDVLGKQVLNAKVANGTVNVYGLTSGVYMVKVTEEGKTSTKKLVIR
jgi:hypothetical protein